jgi:hypothetical protein
VRSRRARSFAPDVLASLRDGRFLYIRAGGEHRFIPIWVVVVEGRAFVRSWTVKRDGWYRAFLEDPRGAIRIGEREVAIRAVPARAERLRKAVDRAYLVKYDTRASLKYARGLASPRRRATTTELVPA